MNLGTPGTLHYLESCLVGIMLVDPTAAPCREALAAIAPSDLSDTLLATIWSATQRTKFDDPRTPHVVAIAHTIWEIHGKPTPMPAASRLAVELAESDNWISTADLPAWIKQWRAVRQTRSLRGEIRRIVAKMDDGQSPEECLDQLTLVRERIALHGH